MARTNFWTVDLFAGAGGLTLGFHQAGFIPIVATDFDPYAAETYRKNFLTTKFIDGPIDKIASNKFLEETNLSPGELGCLLGGPPCQAFSIYNHNRGFHDERSGLFHEYLRVVEALLPKVVVIENVTGMLSLDSGRAVKEIHTRLSELGYVVEHRVLQSHLTQRTV